MTARAKCESIRRVGAVVLTCQHMAGHVGPHGWQTMTDPTVQWVRVEWTDRPTDG